MGWKDKERDDADEQRRVKCDETRPSCTRCLKRKLTCSGFANSTGVGTQHAEPRLLFPAIKTPSIAPVPCSSPFRCEWEKAYFETWFLTSHDICGDDLFDGFSATVTQLAFQDDTIKGAVLALGALKATLNQHADLMPGEQARSSGHYRMALARYGHSLRAVTAMTATENTIGTILQCCVLFFCFNLLDGNHESAHLHIHHGSRILQEFLRSREPTAGLDICATSPAPSVIDDSLIHIFQRCSSVSYVHLAPKRPLRPFEAKLDAETERSTPLKSMLPDTFYNMRDAVRWLDLVQNAALASLASASHPSAPENKWQMERLGFLEVLDGWAAAFLPRAALEAQASGYAPETRAHIAAIKIQWHNVYIFVYTSHFHDYQGLLEMESRFSAIVDLATLLAEEPHQAKPVTPLTISGSILPLFVAANKCRNAEIREAAERALRRLNHRVEGLWDSRAALALVEWARRTEDAYISQFDDPEEVWERVRSRYIIFGGRHGEQNEAIVGSQALEDGEWVYREETVQW